MLSELDGVWSARCGECLVSPPLDVLVAIRSMTRGEVEAALDAIAWELRPDDQLWCLRCSRRAREVPFPTSQRGVRRRRR